MNREIEFRCIEYQRIQPWFHLLALPASNGLFVDSLGLIGYYEIRINSHDGSYALTFRTSSHRAVEIEEVFAGFHKLYPVCFKALGEHFLAVVDPYAALAVTFKESSLHGVGKAITRSLFMIDHHTIDQKVCFMPLYLLPCTVVQPHAVAVNHHSAEALALPQGQLLLQGSSFRQHNRAHQIEPCSVFLRFHILHDVSDGVPANFFSAHGRVRVACARVQ